MQAVRFMLAVAEPAGVEAAALTALARPCSGLWQFGDREFLLAEIKKRGKSS